MPDKDNVTSPRATIEFQEVSAKASDFLHELNDPDLLRNREIPPAVKLELRHHQIAKLRSTIEVLSAKREEFNRKMGDYIANLQQLVEALEQSLSDDEEDGSGDAASQAAGSTLTRVSCLHCQTERRFEGLKVVFARESDESLQQPTELYVLDGRTLKKGRFRCLSCGTESLVIKAS